MDEETLYSYGSSTGGRFTRTATLPLSWNVALGKIVALSAGIALSVFFSLIPGSLSARNINESEFHDLRVCADCKINDLATAIKIARPGQVIEVDGGVYHTGQLDIDKSIKLRGVGNPSVYGEGVGHVFNVMSSGVEISGFVITGSGRSELKEFAGIHAEDVSNCNFHNNTLVNNTYGFYMAKVDSCVIKDNQSVSAAKSEVLDGNGVHLWNSKQILIEHNIFYGHRDGIYMEFSNDIQILSNNSTGNMRYGLHFMFSHRNHFKDNYFSHNGTGVAVMYSKFIDVENNIFENSIGGSSYGALLKDIFDSKFTDNRFEKNTSAIYCDNSLRNRFVHNQFLSNGIAVRLPGNCEKNVFHQNDFIDNYFDFTTNSRALSADLDGNFWSGCDRYDFDLDGRSDHPCNPVQVFSFYTEKYPVLGVLLLSPVVEFLEVAERVLPVISPSELRDRSPAMKPIIRRER